MQKIFDAHCHIYPDKIARAASDGIGDFYGMTFEKVGTVERLLRKGEEAGITHFLVHSVSTTPLQVASINNFIGTTVAEHKECMVGFGTMHPASDDYQRDFEDLLSKGLTGVKLHPDFQQFSLASDEAYNLCKVFAGKVPVLVHAGDPRFELSNPEQLVVLLDRLPDLTVIAAHMGGWSVWERAMKLLPGKSNLYFDTSSSLYQLEPSAVRDMIRLYGVDRVLFGTDYPMWDGEEDLKRFHAMGLTSEEEQKVLFDNAKSLLKFDF